MDASWRAASYLPAGPQAGLVRMYVPPGANCLLSVADHCLRSRHYLNVVAAGQRAMPQ